MSSSDNKTKYAQSTAGLVNNTRWKNAIIKTASSDIRWLLLKIYSANAYSCGTVQIESFQVEHNWIKFDFQVTQL